MVALEALWLPILISTVIVFFASFVAWVVSPHHKSDYARLPGEAELLEAMRKQELSPGQYMFPYCREMKELKEPEMAKKFEEGPVGQLTLRPSGQPPMGKNMAYSVIFYLVVSIFVAYLTSRTLDPGAEYLSVFRIAGTTAVLAYSAAIFPQTIWFGRTWGSTWKEAIDGVVYGFLTAGVFGWLWPN